MDCIYVNETPKFVYIMANKYPCRHTHLQVFVNLHCVCQSVRLQVGIQLCVCWSNFHMFVCAFMCVCICIYIFSATINSCKKLAGMISRGTTRYYNSMFKYVVIVESMTFTFPFRLKCIMLQVGPIVHLICSSKRQSMQVKSSFLPSLLIKRYHFIPFSS